MNINQVVNTLRHEQKELAGKMHAVQEAITALNGKKPSGRVGRVLSPEARKRIGDTQRKRWAKVRKANGVLQMGHRKAA